MLSLAASLQACWALLLDLMASPVPASTLLPPLAAVLDVWPEPLEAMQPAAAAGSGGGGAAPANLSGVHSILQHLCAQAAAEEEHAGEGQPVGAAGAAAAGGAGDAPPPLLLERQPVAAAEFLRRLGQQRWGWTPDAAGNAAAFRQLRVALQQEPSLSRALAAKGATAAVAGSGALSTPAPAVAAPAAAGAQPGAEAVERVMQDGQTEEL